MLVTGLLCMAVVTQTRQVERNRFSTLGHRDYVVRPKLVVCTTDCTTYRTVVATLRNCRLAYCIPVFCVRLQRGSTNLGDGSSLWWPYFVKCHTTPLKSFQQVLPQLHCKRRLRLHKSPGGAVKAVEFIATAI